MNNDNNQTAAFRYVVRFFDPVLSKKGQGSRIARFDNRADADAFAAGKIYRAKPARVEVMMSRTIPTNTS